MDSIDCAHVQAILSKYILTADLKFSVLVFENFSLLNGESLGTRLIPDSLSK